MPATLDSLPDELLAFILDSSAPPFKLYDNSRTKALRPLCLVNKRIARLAQDLLWQQVEISFPDDHDRLETLSANLAARVKTLVVLLEPTDREENGCAEPTKDDMASISELPNVKTLIVGAELVRILPAEREERGASCFTYSTLCIDRSDAGHLRRIDSLWINSAILVLPEVDAVAPFALTRLTLYGRILVRWDGEDTDLSTFLTPAALPNLKVLRLVARENGITVSDYDVDPLWLPNAASSFLDQLDFLQVELPNYSQSRIPGLYTTTSAPTLFSVSPHCRDISGVRHLYTPQIDLVCKYKDSMLDRLPLLEAVFHPHNEYYTDMFMIECRERGVKVIRCAEAIEENTNFVLPEFEAYIKAKRRRT